jgi:hypothetical protein
MLAGMDRAVRTLQMVAQACVHLFPLTCCRLSTEHSSVDADRKRRVLAPVGAVSGNFQDFVAY